jgi:hypothetical protein
MGNSAPKSCSGEGSAASFLPMMRRRASIAPATRNEWLILFSTHRVTDTTCSETAILNSMEAKRNESFETGICYPKPQFIPLHAIQSIISHSGVWRSYCPSKSLLDLDVRHVLAEACSRSAVISQLDVSVVLGHSSAG